MWERLVVGMVAALLGAACLGGGARPPRVQAPAPAAGGLQGEWELVSLEAQGQPLRVSGRLTLDGFSNIAVHAELAPGEAGATPPRVVLLDFTAKASAADGRLTYVGIERRAPPDRMMPTASEPEDWRHYTLEGDQLTLWQESGGARTGVLTFRRVR